MGFGDFGVFKIISPTRENDYQGKGNLKPSVKGESEKEERK